MSGPKIREECFNYTFGPILVTYEHSLFLKGTLYSHNVKYGRLLGSIFILLVGRQISHSGHRLPKAKILPNTSSASLVLLPVPSPDKGGGLNRG